MVPSAHKFSLCQDTSVRTRLLELGQCRIEGFLPRISGQAASSYYTAPSSAQQQILYFHFKLFP